MYSTARWDAQRKGPFLLTLLTHSKSAALPLALISVALLSLATDRGHKMGLEGTQHHALTFLIAPVQAAGTGMKEGKQFLQRRIENLTLRYFYHILHKANSRVFCVYAPSTTTDYD